MIMMLKLILVSFAISSTLGTVESKQFLLGVSQHT